MTRTINTMPSLYLEAGAIHGCVLCKQGTPICYMEDVGRHNAVDKIAGWMYRHGVDPADKILYTTGRLTSEMTIKTVRMGIPILVSRSGFTAWGVDLARQAGLTLVGRARGKRFTALSGEERIVFDQDVASVEEEAPRHRRKGPPMTTERVGDPGRRSRRRAGAAHGRWRQADASDRRAHHPRSRRRAARPAMRRAHPERQWRPCPLRRFRLPVVADTVEDNPGPLAGVLAALDWAAANRPDVEWVVSVAGDCPFLPRDLVDRLHEARMAKVPNWRSRRRAVARIRSSGYGKWRCAALRQRWSRRACARSTAGRPATALPPCPGRTSPSIRSSTPTRSRILRKPNGLPAQLAEHLGSGRRKPPSPAPRGLQANAARRGRPDRGPLLACRNQREIVMLFGERNEAEPGRMRHRRDGDAPVGAALVPPPRPPRCASVAGSSSRRDEPHRAVWSIRMRVPAPWLRLTIRQSGSASAAATASSRIDLLKRTSPDGKRCPACAASRARVPGPSLRNGAL